MMAPLTGNRQPAARYQTGMVLLLCLIFLMALTLLGLSASSDTILQTKLASNLQHSERARQSALLTLAWAENWLLGFDGPPPGSCSARCGGLYIHANGELPLHPESASHSWWVEHGHEAGVDPLTGERIMTISSGSYDTPMWIVETARTVPTAGDGNAEPQTWYRILARGSGPTESAISVVESIVARTWPADSNPGSAVTAVSGRCPGTELTAVCGRFAWRELR